MMNNETLYSKLIDIHLDQPRRMLKKHFAERGEEDAKAVEHLLIRAYQEGHRDGYTQAIMTQESPPPEER